MTHSPSLGMLPGRLKRAASLLLIPWVPSQVDEFNVSATPSTSHACAQCGSDGATKICTRCRKAWFCDQQCSLSLNLSPISTSRCGIAISRARRKLGNSTKPRAKQIFPWCPCRHVCLSRMPITYAYRACLSHMPGEIEVPPECIAPNTNVSSRCFQVTRALQNKECMQAIFRVAIHSSADKQAPNARPRINQKLLHFVDARGIS